MMKKGTLLLLAISLIFCGVSYGQNIIGNPGFEDLSPSFWNPLNGTFGTELGVGTDTTSNVKNGFRSFMITKSGTSTDIIGWKSWDNANLYWNNAGSGTFSVNASIKTVGVNTNPANDDERIGVLFEFKNAAGAELATATLWADQTTANVDWADLSDVVMLTEAPEQVFVTLFMGKNATGTVYFDNVGCNTADSWTMGVFNSGAEDVNGWMDWYGGNGNYAIVTDEETHSGNYSVLLYQDADTTTSQSELVYYSQPYPIEAGEWYKISVWVKTENVPDIGTGEFTYPTGEYYDGGINLCFFTHGGNIDSEWSAQGDRFIYVDQRDSTTEWRLYEGIHKAADDANGISVRARFNNWVTGKAWFDDFSVEKIVPTGDNVIGNPGFEDLSPSFWNPLNGTFGTELGVGTDTTSNVKNGFRSFMITKSGTSTDIIGWKSWDNANLYWNNAGSGTFSVNASIKTVGVNTNPANDDERIGVLFEFKNAAGAELATATLWADQTTANVDWADLSDVVMLTEAPEQVFVTLFMGKNATGTVYFDNVGCNTADSWTMGVFNSGAEDVNGWMDWYGGNGNYAIVTDEETHSGNYSVLLYQDADTTTSQSELVYYSQPYPIEAGEWYKISVWVKTENVPDIGTGEFTYPTGEYYDGGINLCFFTHGGNIDSEWSAQGDRFIYVDQRDSTTEWRLYEGIHKAADDANGISVRARFNNWVTGKAWFDDFSVVKMVVAPGSAIQPKEKDIPEIPERFALHQNYPNPFNPVTTIQYDLPHQTHVSIDIYNIMGQHVKTLVNAVQSPGSYSLIWDATNDRGALAPSGMYLYVLKTNEQQLSKKMVLLR